MPKTIVLTVALAGLAILGYRATLTEEAPAPAPQTTSAAPSPYLSVGVQIERGDHWFHRVSFKDVGLRLSGVGARDGAVEAVAEGIASSLESHLAAHAIHSAELADPAWHRSCQGHHVYVDLWRAESPARVGFSLWRGCDADDQFGWQEILVSEEGLSGDAWIEEAARVGVAIGQALSVCSASTC
jgi:hypothetical protein